MMTAFRFEWIDRYLKREPDVLIDAGTYDATDAIAFKERYPGTRVIAFEACPDNYERIVQQGRAARAFVEVHHAAVCDHENGLPFYSNTDTNQVGHFGQSGSILAPAQKLLDTWHSIDFKPPRQVPSVRLDAFCDAAGIPAIDVLHMDVQGAEYFVLKGLGQLRPPIIFLEINETKEVGRYENAVPEHDIRAWFEAAGYSREWETEFDALYVHKSCLPSTTSPSA